MSVSILEALQNAEINLESAGGFQASIGKAQLKNALRLLEKGYPLQTKVEEMMEDYGSVENAPEYKP